jgi:[acyl-carrier-protein] S-malonyltransferase/trans-AT polyketide synthase/acyltransferase/oxidoreductase domain-containing protein
MARDFHERFAVSREVFAEASEALSMDVAALCFEQDTRLDLTEFTQVAILTSEIAMMRALERELGLVASWFGGHSLGEYTALCAAGAMPLDVAVRAVRKRGALMQRAVPAGQGTMVAVVAAGIANADLKSLLDAFEVDVANRNSLDQVVLAGPTSKMDEACAKVRAVIPSVELVPLAVSAPFHSRHMRVIEEEFRGVLESFASRIDAERARFVTSNVTGGFHTGDMRDLIDALTRQISGVVDWIGNMEAIAKVASKIFEVGPNRPLRGFFKSTGREVVSIINVKTAQRAFA